MTATHWRRIAVAATLLWMAGGYALAAVPGLWLAWVVGVPVVGIPSALEYHDRRRARSQRRTSAAGLAALGRAVERSREVGQLR